MNDSEIQQLIKERVKEARSDFASAGGKARAKKLSPARRSEIARIAGSQAWKSKKK